MKNPNKNEPGLGKTGLIGICLIAGGLFNLPQILKVPETEADKMMLVIVLTLLLAGAMLLFLPGILNKRK